MIDESQPSAEEMLSAAAGLPPLPEAMRLRVLGAVEGAARRRVRLRRVVLTAGLVLCGLSCGLWTCWRPGRASVVVGPSGSEAAPAPTVLQPFDAPSKLLSMSHVGEWAHVECVVRLRTVQSQVFRGTY